MVGKILSIFARLAVPEALPPLHVPKGLQLHPRFIPGNAAFLPYLFFFLFRFSKLAGRRPRQEGRADVRNQLWTYVGNEHKQ